MRGINSYVASIVVGGSIFIAGLMGDMLYQRSEFRQATQENILRRIERQVKRDGLSLDRKVDLELERNGCGRKREWDVPFRVRITLSDGGQVNYCIHTDEGYLGDRVYSVNKGDYREVDSIERIGP